MQPPARTTATRSMAVGGAVGQNIAGMMNGMMLGMTAQQTGAVPPPVPVSAYHVAINGQAAGPFDMTALRQMAASGQLSPGSLVWKAGLSEWIRAESVDEISQLFTNTIPPIPTADE